MAGARESDEKLAGSEEAAHVRQKGSGQTEERGKRRAGGRHRGGGGGGSSGGEGKHVEWTEGMAGVERWSLTLEKTQASLGSLGKVSQQAMIVKLR